MDLLVSAVPRDIADQAIFAQFESGEAKSIFFRENGNIGRLGPAISSQANRQVYAIFSRKPRKSLADLTELPKKTRDIEWLRHQHPIGRDFLSAIDLVRFETLIKCGVFYLPQGWLRIRKWSKEQGVIDRASQHVPDLEAAIRMQDHILNGYRGQEENKGEFGQSASFDEIIRAANRYLTDWKNADRVNQKKIIDDLVTIVLRLELCRNDFKVKARDQITEIIPFEDKTGKINPGAFAASTVAALNQLANRFQEIRAIQPIIALRRELLIYEVSWFELQIKQIAIMLRNLLYRIYYRFPERPEDLDNAFGRVLHFTGFLWPSPYFERAQSADKYILAAKKIARQKKLEKRTKDEMLADIIFAHHLINGGLPPKSTVFTGAKNNK